MTMFKEKHSTSMAVLWLMDSEPVWFLRASAMLKHVIAIGLTSFCLSVRLSIRHTLVLYENGSTYRHDFFTAQ